MSDDGRTQAMLVDEVDAALQTFYGCDGLRLDGRGCCSRSWRGRTCWYWRSPAGGLSLWARLPDPAARQLARYAEHHGVAVAAGRTFGVEPDAHGSRIRLPFVLPPEQIEEGIRRLAAAWHDLQDRGPVVETATGLVV